MSNKFTCKYMTMAEKEIKGKKREKSWNDIGT